ncbi:exodeoxyribonuclease V subunit beta [Massilia sp. DWR3-1-1]|uniref:exodeoxyribonuclease V subunit beta n=1 Tax=Massilia sp. DWR3-1-1 TaxID=2804559 RepID=UPI003CF968FA
MNKPVAPQMPASEDLDPLRFPLHGSRLIEASAGTGKTWTIAALYVRLVLGHGGERGFARPLLPPEILVMTFTRAATRELSNRVRQRLVDAAAYFRFDESENTRDEKLFDPYLQALHDAFDGPGERQQAAHRLMLAAETMDEAAIFTIDAWCQRMLREHAFDSGSLFDEELVPDERALFEDAAHDYWRQNVYPLNSHALAALLGCWSDVGALKAGVRELVARAGAFNGANPDENLASLIARAERAMQEQLAGLKAGWAERADAMEQWIAAQRAQAPKCFNGTKMRADSLVKWFDALRAWAGDPGQLAPALTPAAWKRLTPEGIEDACTAGVQLRAPEAFDATAALQAALAALEPVRHAIIGHAATSIARRMAQLKERSGQFGFADMLVRLKAALEGPNGAALRARITSQYPVAMVDEFQDTSPEQYAVFDLLYQVADNDPARGLFLIGDPKQSIYGFRGADIHSYLAARRATSGRHYKLGTNYRSTAALVEAVNQLFLHAEGHADGSHAGFAAGAFRFRREGDNPLPFDAVAAAVQAQRLVGVAGPGQALAIATCDGEALAADAYRAGFAAQCAEHIVGLLNDSAVGFEKNGEFTRMAPADIAILVRDRREAAAVRRALMARQVRSVYLSDQDSVIDSVEAADMLRWLHAVASPQDGALARAAFATGTAGVALPALARMAVDELAWEERVEQLKNLHTIWQRQGVLAMLRRFIHDLGLPPKLLAQAGGERRLTNLLHLAELLQTASRALDGEQALIRWFSEQQAGLGEGGDERIVRLESDAELVKVVTVHKSKGLEYPLVYLPFAVSARRTDRRNRSFFEYTDDAGARHLDLGLGDEAMAAVDQARLEEDLRLLYVALTRARHFLWLGVAAIAARKAGENRLHESAFGYLVGGGERIAADQLTPRLARLRALRATASAHADASAAIPIWLLASAASADAERVTSLARSQAEAPLRPAAPFTARFERNWSVGSFTSLSRPSAAAPMRALEATLLEEAPQGDAGAAPARLDEAPWHRFPRGSVPGNFLHEQLEWMAQDGFACVRAANFDSRLAARIERAGWGNRQDDAIAWLRLVASTALPPLQAALADLRAVLPEMEFWFPSDHLDAGALDRLCSAHLLDGVRRPALPQRQLHGMLKGFADLVFEHEGRYWVLDYKSNALGGADQAYTRAAMGAGMAAHRYDIQGAIYLLALHRLLRSRLGAAYDPARQLGGAIFLFLRGIANPDTRGCYLLAPDLALLDGIDALLGLASSPASENPC